jgi:hypothetical protein
MVKPYTNVGNLPEIRPLSKKFILTKASAKDLLRKAVLKERHIEHVCVHITNQLMVKQREMLVNELEQYYINRGMFVDIELSGPDKTAIKLMCSLFHDASIVRIADETNFFTHLKKAGFKRVVLEDTDNNAWTYRLGKL